MVIDTETETLKSEISQYGDLDQVLIERAQRKLVLRLLERIADALDELVSQGKGQE